MVRTIAEYAVLPLLAASCLAQNSSGVYELPMTCTKTDQNGRTITGPCKEFMRETQEKYCRENPKDARCSGKPIDFKPYHLPPSGSAPRRTSRPSASPMSAVPIGQVALHDWRFAHSSPALLLSVNIGSLLKSPLWGTLLPVSAPDLERARAALSGIGQILL